MSNTLAIENTEVESAEVRGDDSSLRASIRDGVSCATMTGCAETYFGAAGIFLQAGTVQVGLLSSLPQLFGSVLQWISALKMDRIRSRRKVVVVGAAAQALSLVPMALLPFLFEGHQLRVLLLLALVLTYHGANGATVPIWNSLIGDLVPPLIRGRFFGHRNMLTGMANFVALLLAGLVLNLFDHHGVAAYGFFICFAAAFVARMNSVRWLARYEDPELRVTPDQVFTFRQFLRRSLHSNFAKFVFFVGAINFGVAFSGPYFALYMLRDLHFSYVEFTLVSATATIAQFLTFRYWGGLSDRFGNKKILNICGWGVAVIPSLWLFSAAIPYLIAVQAFGGFVWSGFSLACANFLFDAVTPPKRARCVAYQALVNGFSVFLGSMAGGYAAIHLPTGFFLGPWTWEPAFILPVIFLISGFIRLLATSLLLRRFQEVRPVEPIGNGELVFRISQIKLAGEAFSLFTGFFRDQKSGATGSQRSESPSARG